jgi:hypothetical protein
MILHLLSGAQRIYMETVFTLFHPDRSRDIKSADSNALRSLSTATVTERIFTKLRLLDKFW